MLKIIDLAERAFMVLIAIPFLVAFARVLPTHPWLVLLAISETLAVVLILIRRPGEIAATPYAFVIAFAGTALPLLIRPQGGIELVPTVVASILMFAGLGLNILSKLFLNRSFGIVAANRGIKRGGPYRLVRHPMYLGYITTQVGFLLTSFNFTNLGLYALAWTLQILRIREEEKFLMRDEHYHAYSQRVGYRLIPKLY